MMVCSADGIPPWLSSHSNSGNQALSPPSLGPGNKTICLSAVLKQTPGQQKS